MAEQRLILKYGTPLAHNEHCCVETRIKVLKDFLMKSGELGTKHSFLEWESIVLNISAAINDLPICFNGDDQISGNHIGLVTPNMFLDGRNNQRSPYGFADLHINAKAALSGIREHGDKLLHLLGDHVHRFIPGRELVE